MRLLEPATIGNIRLKNRLVFAATTTLLSGEDGYLTDREKAFHVERARGGTGLVIVPSYVLPYGRNFPTVAGIWEDGQIAGWRDLASQIQAYGKACIQLMHAGRYMHHSFGVKRVVPSAVAPRIPRYLLQQEMTLDDIHGVVQAYGAAARRAREAGFDALEIMAAAGYLLASFISPWSNRRTDEYGGSPQNRARLLLEIIQAARREASDLSIVVRMNADDLIPGGTPREELLQLGLMCQDAGVDAISLTVGWHESSEPAITAEIPDGHWLPLAAPWKKALRIPIIMAYRLRTPEMAEKAVQEGQIDFAAMCRPLIADPEIANKLQQGRPEDIIPCVTCNQGCFQRLFNSAWVQCLANPRSGRESLEEYRIQPAPKPKRVLVVGGGPAGLEAARVASLRGHRVVLCEKLGRLGGQLNPAAVPPHRKQMAEMVSYLSRQVEELGVEVRLNTEVTSDIVASIAPDAVVIATGASPLVPDLAADGMRLVTCHDLLEGLAEAGSRVLVLGADQTGAETAEHLASKGRQVVLVDQSGQLAKDATSFDRVGLKVRLTKLGVRSMLKSSIQKISNGKIRLDAPEGSTMVEADTIAVSMGMTPNQALYQDLKDQGYEVYAAGDCVSPRKSLHAIHEGFKIGNQV